MVQEMTLSKNRNTSHNGSGEALRSTMIFKPRTDIYETDDHVVLVADMPGVAPKDVSVDLEHNVLTIRGHVPGTSPEGYRRLGTEYGEGDYQRAFTLSHAIDSAHVEASHRNGVLTVRMPKAEAAKTRRIKVKAA